MCYWYTTCVAVLVVDSSALITLAGGDALSLLRLSPRKAVTVPEVYQEVVEAGLAGAYPDVLAIRCAFEDGIVAVRLARRSEKIAGISRTDSLIILLAEELGAAELLINDRGLYRKAGQRSLPARLTAEFVHGLYRAGRIEKGRRDTLLGHFVSNGRYSEAFLNAFLAQR